mgnify:CR=1 FL=1
MLSPLKAKNSTDFSAVPWSVGDSGGKDSTAPLQRIKGDRQRHRLPISLPPSRRPQPVPPFPQTQPALPSASRADFAGFGGDRRS